MESSRSKAREQAQRSVRYLIKEKAESLRSASPNVVYGLLAGSALAPLAATLGPDGPAVAAAFATVVGGVGTNLLSELLSNSLEKARQRNEEAGKGEAEVADAIAQDLSAALARNDTRARQLSAQVIDVLERLGGFDAALAAATGDLHDHLAMSLGEVARRSDRVIEALVGIRKEQRQQRALLEENADRLRLLSRPGGQASSTAGLAVPARPVFVTAEKVAQSDEAPLAQRWRAGEEGWVGDRRYLLLQDKARLLQEEHDASGEHVRRQALARQILPAVAKDRAYAWLRQAGHGLTRERDLLGRARDMRMSRDLPAVAFYDATAGTVTLALSWPAERDGQPCETSRVRFPPGALDEWPVSLLLAGLRGLARTLGRLHRLDASHRALTPEGILVVGDSQFALRDLGLAAIGFRPGEGSGDYQAPEQAFGARMSAPGPTTDVYQLALIAYHLITGRVPTQPGRVPPPRHPGLSEAVGAVIAAILSAEPKSRPSLREFRAALQLQR
jgi:hypothetical protein